MSIRISMVAHDHPALRRLHRETLPSDRLPPWKPGWWWIAFDGEKAVGFAGMSPSLRWSDALYLCRSGVTEGYRGRGLQRRLIAARERHARRLGMTWLITSTLQNPASANSLIGCGFRMYEPAVPWGARGTLYWRKRINPSSKPGSDQK